ncbi:MAG: glutamate racemase [Chlamydiota bacterium]
MTAIGIFDSGFGGLTVLKAIQELLPSENCIYFGDTARLPYGDKSPEMIRKFCIENTAFLLKQNIKLLVIACNTACAWSFEEIQKICDIPVIGVITPVMESFVELPSVKNVAILGTRATIASKLHEKLLQTLVPDASFISIACPLFVPLIEEGYIDHPLTRMVIHEYLRPLKEKEMDTILLACTHYPLIEKDLKRELGTHIHFVNPAKSCAEEVRRCLIENHLLKESGAGMCQFFVTDDPEKFRFFGTKFLDRSIEIVNLSFEFLPSELEKNDAKDRANFTDSEKNKSKTQVISEII